MSSLLVGTGVASGENVSVIRLADRRDGTIEKDWVFQREVEAALYGHADIWSGTEEELRRSFGAVFAAVLDEENPRERLAGVIGFDVYSRLYCSVYLACTTRPPFNRAEALYLLHAKLMRDYALPRGKARDALIRFFPHAFTRYLDRF